jgi:hypothetical protein
MAPMAKCPFCDNLLNAKEMLASGGASCPRCGSPLPASLLPVIRPGPATAVRKQPVPAAATDLGRVRSAAGADANTLPMPSVPANDSEPMSHAGPLRSLDLGAAMAFVLGSVALLIASIPPVSFLTKPLAILGLVLGLGSLIAAAVKRDGRIVWPLAASALCLTMMLFVGSWPDLRGTEAPKLLAVPFRKAGMVANQPIKDDDWVDASVNAVRRDDVRVQVLSARIGPVDLQSKSKLAGPFLVITLQASYDGVIFREVPYDPWTDRGPSRSKHPALLSDNMNRTFEPKAFDAAVKIAGRRDKDALTPGHQVKEILIYAPPPTGVDYLRLELPAAAFGGTGAFKFQIPRGMFARPGS